MSAEDVALSIILSAKDNTQAGLNSAKAGMSSLEKAVSAATIATHALTGLAGGALVGALSDAANAAAEDEASVLRLKQAVENSGASWEANVGQIQDRIKAGQNMAFTDDQVRDSLALLTAQTGNVDDALKRQTLAMDFARGAGLDLHTASKLLGKVTDENINVFARYGIHIEKGGDATAAFAAIQQKFGGQAKVYGDSTAGSIFKVRDSIAEWKESMGAALGPAQGIIGVLPGLHSGASLAAGSASGLATALKGVQASALLALGPIALIVGALILIAVKAREAADEKQKLFTPEEHAQYVQTQKDLRDAGLSYDAMALTVDNASKEVKTGADTSKQSIEDFARGAGLAAEGMDSTVTTAAQGMKSKVVTIFDQMKTSGVGSAQLMETDTVLAAMGMSADVRQAAADMEAGVTGKTAAQREQVIFDMQTAKLQAAQRAAGMSEDVIKAIDTMVFESRAKFLLMKDEQAAKFDAMTAKGKNLDGSLDENTAAVGRLKWSIDQLQSKTINVTVNRISAFQQSERDENPPLFARGGQMMAGPSYGGAKVAVFGEAGNESATFQRSDGSGYQGRRRRRRHRGPHEPLPGRRADRRRRPAGEYERGATQRDHRRSARALA